MRFQFHEHEILQTTEKILRENMEAVRELQSSQKPTPTATASKEDKKGKDKERLEEEGEEDLQLEEHKDALWDSLVLIQGLMKTDPEAVLGTLKAEEVIETVTTLLKSSVLLLTPSLLSTSHSLPAWFSVKMRITGNWRMISLTPSWTITRLKRRRRSPSSSPS